MTRLSCSQCPDGNYICCTEGGYICKQCAHQTYIEDFTPHLDEGESLVLDDDGYLGVVLFYYADCPLEHPHDGLCIQSITMKDAT